MTKMTNMEAIKILLAKEQCIVSKCTATNCSDCVFNRWSVEKQLEAFSLATEALRIYFKMNIKNISLLSVEEYYKYKNYIKPIDNWWWLRSPGINSNSAAGVDYDGSVYESGTYVINSFVSVRPILIVETELKIGETFVFGNKSWTMISENIALCDESFCQMPFRKDWLATNVDNYEFSDIKKYLDNWLEKNI